MAAELNVEIQNFDIDELSVIELSETQTQLLNVFQNIENVPDIDLESLIYFIDMEADDFVDQLLHLMKLQNLDNEIFNQLYFALIESTEIRELFKKTLNDKLIICVINEKLIVLS